MNDQNITNNDTPAAELLHAIRNTTWSSTPGETPGAVYHLISRFVASEWFVDTHAVRESYLNLLGSALETSDWRCLAYAIMSNHIHLAMVAGRQPLAKWIRRVHSPFGHWMNSKHDRIGAVFARGPARHFVPSTSVARVIAYQHNNPVRAHVVDKASDSDWTSHRAYLGLVQPAPWLHVDEGLARAGFASAALFNDWVNANEKERWLLPRGPRDQDEQDARERRRAARAKATPTPTRTLAPAADEIVRATAAILDVPMGLLVSRRRTPSIVHARSVAVSAGLRMGMTMCDLAKGLDVSAQAVSAIAARNTVNRTATDADQVIATLDTLFAKRAAG